VSVTHRRADARQRRSSGRSPHQPPRSLARVETEAEEEMKLGFSGERPAPRYCCRESHAQPSISDERLIRVGLDKAQAGGENASPGLRCFKFCAVSWVKDRFSFLTRARISCLGSIRPRWAERKSAQAYAALIFVRGLGNRAIFLFWVGLESILFRNQLKNF
jgi:hypothetical protein